MKFSNVSLTADAEVDAMLGESSADEGVEGSGGASSPNVGTDDDDPLKKLSQEASAVPHEVTLAHPFLKHIYRYQWVLT